MSGETLYELVERLESKGPECLPCIRGSHELCESPLCICCGDGPQEPTFDATDSGIGWSGIRGAEPEDATDDDCY